MEDEQPVAGEPSELGIEMLPIALAALRTEVGEARALIRELAAMTPEQADSSWCDRLEDEYHDAGAGQAAMARQLRQWQLDHPEAAGLDELAGLVADVEPVRQALLHQLARLRCARGTSGTRVLPGRTAAELIRDEPLWTFSHGQGHDPRALHVWREDDAHLVAIVAARSPEGGVDTAEAGDAVAARLTAEHPDREIEVFVWTPGSAAGSGDRFERVTPGGLEPVPAHDVIDRLAAAERYRCDCSS
ncbi:hypothetical protein [Nocardia sp. NRRL S-836]|uniref:hypothetical protein n=1 Tax=Nocardia sp. NRRL S-836 TaxID=1519492 RepID=UPI0006AEC027|nr:hypothetical protein [Nocardia sp. NRRL S-836]KOV85363.1 hypothetical protein ADL03_14635 [Nocardia sp. NRRL S-836]